MPTWTWTTNDDPPQRFIDCVANGGRFVVSVGEEDGTVWLLASLLGPNDEPMVGSAENMLEPLEVPSLEVGAWMAAGMVLGFAEMIGAGR